MKITVKKIESYDPCKSGINNFKSKYPKFNDNLSVLLSLDDIPYSDKVWLICRVVDIKTLQQWGVECAEMILHYYEEAFPSDRRVRDCLEVTKSYLLNEATIEELLTSAEAAARASGAAWAAGAAAEVTRAAEAAAWAARASAWAVGAAEAAAEAAEAAAKAAWAAQTEQESLNLSILIALLENQGM